jgi:hypothetical protein
MGGSTKALALGVIVYFTTRDPMATLVAAGGSIALDMFL